MSWVLRIIGASWFKYLGLAIVAGGLFYAVLKVYWDFTEMVTKAAQHDVLVEKIAETTEQHRIELAAERLKAEQEKAQRKIAEQQQGETNERRNEWQRKYKELNSDFESYQQSTKDWTNKPYPAELDRLPNNPE